MCLVGSSPTPCGNPEDEHLSWRLRELGAELVLPPEEEVEGAKGLGTMFSFGFLKLTLAAVAREAAFLFCPLAPL